MTKSTMIVIAAALLMGGTSLASAKNKGAAAHSKPSRPSVNEVTPRPGINEVAPRSAVPDPYYGSDLYRGLFDFYAMPPYSPGNAYRYMRPVRRP